MNDDDGGVQEGGDEMTLSYADLVYALWCGYYQECRYVGLEPSAEDFELYKDVVWS